MCTYFKAKKSANQALKLMNELHKTVLNGKHVDKHELVQRIIIAYEKYDKMEEYNKVEKTKKK